jgi:transposase-like protein
MARFSDEFRDQIQARAERQAPGTPLGAMARFGWNTGDIAGLMGVSSRTARRWRQFNTVPPARRGDWHRATTAAAAGRIRARMERRGLSGMEVTGTYKISKTTYRAGPGSPVRIMPGNKISPAQMRGYFSALDQGDAAAADALLTQALADAYEVPSLTFEDVDDVHFDI